MPNWVSNWVGVSGTEADITAFVEKAGKQYPTKATTWNSETKENETKDAVSGSPFSFWNFIEPEDKEAYWADAHGKKPDEYEGWTKEEQFAFDLKFTGNGWYDWNIREWGTKWDAGSPNVEISKDDKGNASANITFETAWSIPEPVFVAMVTQHPTLNFDFECEEEQGWGAEFSSSDGEDGERSLILTKEWDIPDCHADYVARDRECPCEHSDDQDDWYEDCPRPEQDFYVVVTKTYRVRTNTAENAWELAQDNNPDEQMELLEDDTHIEVRGENGERLYPTLNDGEGEVKTCDHKFVPLHRGSTEQTGWACVFCDTEKELDTETESV